MVGTHLLWICFTFYYLSKLGESLNVFKSHTQNRENNSSCLVGLLWELEAVVHAVLSTVTVRVCWVLVVVPASAPSHVTPSKQNKACILYIFHYILSYIMCFNTIQTILCDFLKFFFNFIIWTFYVNHYLKNTFHIFLMINHRDAQ